VIQFRNLTLVRGARELIADVDLLPTSPTNLK
jgi:hypothetical protein